MSDAPDSRRAPAAIALARLAVAGTVFTLAPMLLFGIARELGWTSAGGPWERAYGMGAFGVTGLLLAWLALVQPTGVPLRPVRPFAVAGRYALVFAPLLALIVGYLKLAESLGRPVPPQDALLHLAEHGTSAPDSWVVIAVVVVGAPLAEELVFRGWLQQALESLFGPRVALWTTATLFGLAHGIDYALPMGAFGLFLGWLRNRHRSLGAPMLAHAIHNGLTCATAVLWPVSLDWMYSR